MYYTNLFFIYSILGHLLEKVLYPTHTSGILYGWWTPIYGIGALIIILSYKFVAHRKKLNTPSKFITIFLIGSVFLSFIEWLGGNLIELIFGITFWDYSDKLFAIGKYASLEMALIWGIASLILICFIQPVIDKLVKKIPKWLSISLIILFVSDIVFTVFLRAK